MLIVGPRGIGGSEGGVEKFAEEFCVRAQWVFDLSILLLSPVVDARFARVSVITAPKSRRLRTDKLFYYLWALKECLTGSYDAIFLLGINSAFLGAFIRLRGVFGRRPVVVARTGSIDYHLPKWGRLAKLFFRLSERMLLLSDAVIAVSPTLQKHLSAIGVKSTLIRNGIAHPPVPREPSTSSPLIVAVGRITAQKNYRVLCDAARSLDEGVEVQIIGGPDRTSELKKLEHFLLEHQVDRVKFTGALPRETVLQRLEHASVFVNCSMHEGMSNSVLEAVQMGVPLVLSDIDANRDLGFEDHLYFDPFDPHSLARTLADALAHPARYLAPSDTFQTWDNIVDLVIAEIYKSSDLARLAPGMA